MLKLIRFLIFFAFTAAVTYLILTGTPIRTMIKNKVEEAFYQQTGFKIAVGKIAWRPPFALALEDVSAEKGDGTKILIENTYLRPSLKELISGNLILRRVYLRNVTIDLPTKALVKQPEPAAHPLSSLNMFPCSFELADIRVDGIDIRGEGVPNKLSELKTFMFFGSVACNSQAKTWSSTVKVKDRHSVNLLATTIASLSMEYQDDRYLAKFSLDEKNGGVLLPLLDVRPIDQLGLKASLKGKINEDVPLQPLQFDVNLACEGEYQGEWHSETKLSFLKEDQWRGHFYNEFTGSLQGTQKGDCVFESGQQIVQATWDGNVHTPQWGNISLSGQMNGLLSKLKGLIELQAPDINSQAKLNFQYDKTLLLPDIDIDWDGTKVVGDLEASLSPLLLQGDLSINHLPIQTFLPLTGLLNGKIHLVEKNDLQGLQLRLTAEKLLHNGIFIEALHLQGAFEDLFGKADGALHLSANNLSWKGYPLGDIQASTHHHQQLEWPFELHFVKDQEASPWKISAKGHMLATSKKASLSLKELSGQIADSKVKLSQSFEANYQDNLLTFSPFKLLLDDSILYVTLNEISNNYELSAHFLNVSPNFLGKFLPIDIHTGHNLPWNFKGHLHWPDTLENIQFKLTASQKDTSQATTLLASLKNFKKRHVICKWEWIHPEKGLLRLFSDDMKQVKLQSKGECAFNAPSILSLFEHDTLPEFNGNLFFDYQLPHDNGQIFTHIQFQEDVFRLLGIDLRGDSFIAKGSIAYDTKAESLAGELKGEMRDHAASAKVELNGALLSPSIKVTANYLPGEEKEPIEVTAMGTLNQRSFKGNGKAATKLLDFPLNIEASYEIELNDALTTSINAKAAYADKRKVATRLGSFNAELNLGGPLKQLQGDVVVKGHHLKIEGNKFPAWTMQTKLTLPLEQASFSLQFDNQSYVEGIFTQKEGVYELALNKAETVFEKNAISLSSPWSARFSHGFLESSPMTIKAGNGLLQLQAKGETSHFEFDIKGNNLPAILPFSLSTPFAFSGNVNLEGHLNGPLNAPKGSLQLGIDHLHFEDKFFGNAPYCKARFSSEINSGSALFKGEMLCPGIEPVVLNAELPISFSVYPFEAKLSDNAPVDVNLQASGALGPILDFFVPHVNAVTGYLNLSLNLKGTVDKPMIEGIIALEKGSYENLETGTLLKDILIRARAKDNHITIEELYGTDGKEGTLQGKGHLLVDPKQGFPFELTCHLEKILLIQKDFVRSAFSGDIQFKGDTQSAVVKGEIAGASPIFYIPEEIPDGTDTVDVVFVNIPENKQRRAIYESPSAKSEYPISLDLEVKTANKLRIRGRGLESTWKGQAHLSGPLSSPNVQGEVKILDGRYDFKGRIFELSQGTITFAGPWDTKTKLYIIGSLEIDDTTIEALLRGPLKNPTLAFRSNPAMSQKEIVSYLLFGKGPSDITPYQGNQLSRSISNLNNGDNSPDLLTDVRNKLRIDRLDINREMTSTGDKVSVQVGKYICKGVYVSLNKSITDDGNSIAVDAKVINHVRARAQITDNAETQLLLKWKKDF